MSERIARPVALVVLFSLMTSFVLAQANSGVLSPAAGTKLNGKAVATSTGVFPGDKIETGPAPAEMNTEGGSIRMLANTSVTFGNTVELECGAAEFFSFRQDAVRAWATEIKPAATEATKFALTHEGGKLLVTVLVGSVLVKENGQVTTLRAGDTTARAGNPSCAVGVPAVPPTTPAAGSSKGRLIGIVAALGAGGALAGVLASRRQESPVSPSRP